jgi:hypothetical protein
METNNMARYCKKCGDEIHPKRVEILPNVSTCVNCSDTKAKRSITVQLGEGDHTYNELIIMDADEYQKLEPYINPRVAPPVVVDEIEEEEETKKPKSKKELEEEEFKDWDITIADGLEELEKDENIQDEMFD